MKYTTIEQFRQCPGCKTVFSYRPDLDYYRSVGVMSYGVNSPECAATFCDILAREGELYGYPPAHRLIVDAYAVQHPPHRELQLKLEINKRLIDASIQSVCIHAIALYAAIEKNIELTKISRIMDRVLSGMNSEGHVFEQLEPPVDLGNIKALDVKMRCVKTNYRLTSTLILHGNGHKRPGMRGLCIIKACDTGTKSITRLDPFLFKKESLKFLAYTTSRSM